MKLNIYNPNTMGLYNRNIMFIRQTSIYSDKYLCIHTISFEMLWRKAEIKSLTQRYNFNQVLEQLNLPHYPGMTPTQTENNK